MITLTGQSYRALVAQALPWYCFVGAFSPSLLAWAVSQVDISKPMCHS
jgi:hypothetical protein